MTLKTILLKFKKREIMYKNIFLQKKFEFFFSEKFFKEKQKNILPRKALFNISNICTSNCVFCAYQYNKDEKMIMSDELFEQCCSQYCKMQPNSWVSLTPLLGEPFTDPNIFNKIEIAKKHGAKRLEIYSNATLLKNCAGRILDSKLDDLLISFPDFNKKEYELIFRTNLYESSIEGINYLFKKHKASGSNLSIAINVRPRRNKEKIKEEADYLKFIAPYLSDKVKVFYTKEYDNWAGMIKQEDLPDGMKLKDDIKDIIGIPCMRLFKVMFLANGDVKLCGCRCKDTIFDELVIGNIYKNSLEEIWFSEPVFELRNRFLLRDYPEVCRNCTHYKTLSYQLFK